MNKVTLIKESTVNEHTITQSTVTEYDSERGITTRVNNSGNCRSANRYTAMRIIFSHVYVCDDCEVAAFADFGEGEPTAKELDYKGLEIAVGDLVQGFVK